MAVGPQCNRTKRCVAGGWTALHYAGSATPSADNAAVIALLLEGPASGRADLEAVGPRGWSTLHLAASNGNLQLVKELLKATASPGAETATKLTPLHVAANGSMYEVRGSSSRAWGVEYAGGRCV